MTPTDAALAELAQHDSSFVKTAGGLCLGLFLTERARIQGLPLTPVLTKGGGQVAGLNADAVGKILARYGITQKLAAMAGRTNRATPNLSSNYVAALNSLHATGGVDLDAAMEWWVGQTNLFFARKGPKFQFDTGKSVAANLDQLFAQALTIQRQSGSGNYVGAMLQHLIGAKIDLILGEGVIQHHGSSVADQNTGRSADFNLRGVAIHVTTQASEALIQKIGSNIREDLKPVIVTLSSRVAGAWALLEPNEWNNRVDVLDATQFLTSNVYEHSLFIANDRKDWLSQLIKRYNEIVLIHEKNPVLRIELPDEERKANSSRVRGK